MSEIIGFIGLGAMGFNMAHNLFKTGAHVIGCDLSEEAQKRWHALGGEVAEIKELIQRADIVMSAVSDSDAIEKLADNVLIPNARSGQIFVDFTTVRPVVIRRLYAEYAAKGAALVEAPMTGGDGGAAKGHLHFFCAGDKNAFEKVRPFLEKMGIPDRIDYCGGAGQGQIMKGVNQLGMGLIKAATLEAMAYGLRAGLDPEMIDKLIGRGGGFRMQISDACHQAKIDNLQWQGIKYDQFSWFIEEAEAQGFELPISKALKSCLAGRPEVIREANRMTPSFWHYLTKASES